MNNDFDLICYNFQQKIIEMFNEQTNIPFQLKYYLFKELWEVIKETKIQKDYEIRIKNSKQDKVLTTEIPIPENFLNSNQRQKEQDFDSGI